MTARRTTSSSSAVVVLVGQVLDDRVEQVAGAEALRGGDGDRLAEAERVELVRRAACP